MLADLLSECFAADLEETWERERTVTLTRRFASRSHTKTLRLHATGCSLREIATILAELGVERSHQAIWQWVHRLSDNVPDPPEAQPKRVAVDETAVKINGEWSWLYAAIDLDTKLILDIAHRTFDRSTSTGSRGSPVSLSTGCLRRGARNLSRSPSPSLTGPSPRRTTTGSSDTDRATQSRRSVTGGSTRRAGNYGEKVHEYQ